jgi:hypothetical protein
MKRARIVLGNPEIEKLERGESLIVRLKSGEQIEIKASILVRWHRYSEGSVESILQEMKRR